MNRFNLVIGDFLTGSGPERATGEIPNLNRRLAANLDMTGLFRLMDPRASLESDPRAGLLGAPSLDYAPWARIGANFVIKGAVTTGSKLSLELRLFNVSSGQEMLAKRLTGAPKDGRAMINRFTNEVILAITGVPGVFGSKIIYVGGSKNGKQIMLTELGSDEATTLASSRGGPSTQPTLGPGGKTSWIHRNGKKWELLVNGRVIYSGEPVIAPAFTPGGAVAAGLSGRSSTNIAMFDGRTPRVITRGGGIEISPTFAPDGRMAYVSDQAGTPSIYVASSPGGSGARLSPGGKSTDPSWSPKGDKIAFVVGERDVAIINPDGSGYQMLTGGQGRNLHPSFSPDGRMIVFSSTRSGQEKLYVMAANGDRQQPLSPLLPGVQSLPSWSPEMPPMN
jgi:TolB protein